MMSKTHNAASAACSIVICSSAVHSGNKINSLIMIAVSMIVSLWPDMDTPYSKIGRKLLFILWPFYLFQYVCSIIFPKIYKVVKHKGVFHWLLFWMVFFFLVNISVHGLSCSLWQIDGVISSIIAGAECGIFSHLFCDYLAEGIYPYAPFSYKRKQCVVHFETGGFAENLIFVFLVWFDMRGIVRLFFS